MLRIKLSADDLGRVRFANAPAPVLESALMLFELRSRSHAYVPAPQRGRDDWRMRVRTRFPDAARPLLNLVAASDHVLLLDVLTSDAEEAFRMVLDSPSDVHERNLAAMERLRPGCSSAWLNRFHESDPRILEPLEGAMRAFHKEHIAPYWSPITDRFDEDVDCRTAMMRDQGVAAMLENLHPSLSLDGSTLYSPHPREFEVDLSGRGVVLMPSMFWTGRPLLTWDPQDPSTNVLIYPAKPLARKPVASAAGTRESTIALARLLGPTRAAILNRLRHPGTTSGVAGALGISVSSASAHTAALRDAGLITTRRTGKSVEHQLTQLGRSLLTHARATAVE